MSTDHSPHDRSLLSSSTILILSAFLVGLAAGGAAGSELSPYVLACGAAGLVSFFALKTVARRRHEKSVEQEQRHVEDRLDRHIKPADSHAPSSPRISRAERLIATASAAKAS